MELVELMRSALLPENAEPIGCVDDLPPAVVVVFVNRQQHILSVHKLFLAQLERTVLPKFIVEVLLNG